MNTTWSIRSEKNSSRKRPRIYAIYNIHTVAYVYLFIYLFIFILGKTPFNREDSNR